MQTWDLPETPTQVEERLKTGLLTVNMGPQHPATHGVLRVEIKTDSEIVAQAIPHIGYLHRCMEKHSENLDFRGIIPLKSKCSQCFSMQRWRYPICGIACATISESVLISTRKTP